MMSMRSHVERALMRERSARRHAFRINPFMCGACLCAVLCVMYVVSVWCDAFFTRKTRVGVSRRRRRKYKKMSTRRRRRRLTIYVTLYNLHNSTSARAIYN
jgi:hypothetical protein